MCRRLDNRGRVGHEVIIARLNPGVTLERALDTQRIEGDIDAVADMSEVVLFAEPGRQSTGKLIVDLTSGRTYALLCFFRDTEEAPPHVAVRMVASFTVR